MTPKSETPDTSAPATMTDYGWLPDDLRAYIRQCEDAYPPDAVDFSVAEQRAFYDALCRAFDRPHPPGLKIEDRAIAGVPCRIYQPQTVRHASVTAIYYHGGGFVVGGLDSHDAICAELAAGAGLRMIAVDYRLSPEHRHPAAFDDALAVASAVGGPKVLIGDSAGGNLAAAVAAQNLPGVAAQVLIYPGLGGDMTLPSYTRHANAPLLTRADVEYYHKERHGGVAAGPDPTAAPLDAEAFDHLPPTAVFTAECDPLASDGVEYAARLAEAGVSVSLVEEKALVHGYLRARHSVERARASFARITAALDDLAGAATADQ